MAVQYYAKVTNMESVEVAIATNEQEAQTLRERQYEPCSRAFYESKVRVNITANQNIK